MPVRTKPPFTSALVDGNGFAIFRSDWTENADYLLMEYGPFGSGHDHFDKGTLYMCARGCRWMVGSPYHDAATASQNTVCVDGEDQRPEAGTLTLWEHGDMVDVAAIHHTAYEHIEHRRAAIYLRGHYFLVVDLLKPLDGKEHTYTWGFNTPARDIVVHDGSARLSFRERRLLVAPVAADAPLEVSHREAGWHMRNADIEGSYADVRRFGMTQRTSGIARFAVLLMPFEGEPPDATVRRIPTSIPDADAIEVTFPDHTDTFLISLSGTGTHRPVEASGRKCVGFLHAREER